jgi:hypothetical protein
LHFLLQTEPCYVRAILPQPPYTVSLRA